MLLAALTTTGWPLIVFLQGLLPKALPLGRLFLGVVLLVALGMCLVLVVRGQERSPGSFRLWWLIIGAWSAALGAVAGMVLLIWLVLDTPRLAPPTELTPRALDSIATRAFAVVAGLGGVALLVIAYRRQRTIEAGEEREVTKLFTDSFDSASDKLGSEHAAVRLAGVHALARLADEAPEGREDLVQMVIDVLCAYLRMPYPPAPDPLPKNASNARREEHRVRKLDFTSFREVRHTIIRIIGNHLREPTRWRGKNYDFTGAVFDGGDLIGAHFTGGKVSFHKAEFTDGTVYFHRARFTGGEVDFHEAEFTGGQVAFYKAEFTGGKVFFFEARFAGGKVHFDAAHFTGGEVFFHGAHFIDGTVSFRGARFTGSKAHFHAARFTGGKVDFHKTEFTDGTVSFRGARFTGSKAHFHAARFTGGRVDFTEAKFTSGQVDFTEAEFTGGKVDFGWGGFAGDLAQFRKDRGVCPNGLQGAKARAMPGTLLTPQAWEIPCIQDTV
ncbi:pentapeptide repeat-containing protein [Nocardiopsis dassonvillei]|uniref:pentapeptide repeat-containing protein n=1 Tax=Nocardiopsis dassonvillei TaxID=2014 RepID=UPI0033EB3A72